MFQSFYKQYGEVRQGKRVPGFLFLISYFLFLVTPPKSSPLGRTSEDLGFLGI